MEHMIELPIMPVSAFFASCVGFALKFESSIYIYVYIHL
jgi:hypothetical protein